MRFLPLLLLLTGCDLFYGHACTLMYVPDQVVLNLNNVDFSEEGLYEFRVQGDGDVIVCQIDPESTTNFCRDNSSSYEIFDDSMTLRAWDFAPDSLTVTMSIDDVERHSDTIALEYQEDEPNGEGCGVSYYAEATIDFSGS
ncbi:MAG: hypothetical protein AAFV53_26605 [Myxococcota bacterium]